jgi:hypothetical protein
VSDDNLPAIPDETRLDAGRLEEVLRRAVELEHRRGPASSTDFTVDDAVRVAAEIGVSEGAVRDALVLVQREELMKPERPPGAVDRWFGSTRFISARTVPGPVSKVRSIIGEVLSDQLFQVSRNMGTRVIWERSESWIDGLRRALDFAKSYRLTDVELIDVLVQDAAAAGKVDVRIEIHLPAERRRRIRQSLVWPTLVGGGLLAIGGAMLGGAPVMGVLFATGGAATGAGMHMRTRGKYRKTATDAQTNVERLLDYLEHEA